MDDAALLNELGPTVEQLLERHLATAKEWFPHEMVPWSRGRDFVPGEDWDPAEVGLAPAAYSALLVNLLTEDNLPYYFGTINHRLGAEGAWGEWTRRWVAEEGRHSIAIRDYLVVTRALDPRSLERARMHQVSNGIVPDPGAVADGIVYVALQELATRIAHRNTGNLLEDPAGREIMSRVAQDENLHHLFYRDLATAALEIDPSTLVEAIDRQVREFAMPGTGIPDFSTHAKLIANAGVYDFVSHHDQILVPIIVKHWHIDQIENLKAAAEQARDRLMHHIDRVARAAERLVARRAKPRPA